MNKASRKLHLRCAEELNELACRLLQQVNKPDKDYSDRIREEILDVQVRLEGIMPLYYTNKFTPPTPTPKLLRIIKRLRKEDKERATLYAELSEKFTNSKIVESSPELTERYQK